MRLMLAMSASLAVLAACAEPETEAPEDETATEPMGEETNGDAMDGEMADDDAAMDDGEMAGDEEAGDEAEPTEWGYSGDIGAASWHELDEAWEVCETGDVQSPIDFADMAGGEAVTPTLDWTRAEAADIIDNGHTIQANLTNAGSLTLDGTEYALVQFHFHAGSEHTVDGERLPLEVHFVHASEAGELAVVGVLFEEGEAAEALEPVWSNLPEGEGNIPVGDVVDPTAFLPEDLTAWRYPGSLTTPPCSEGVAWTVMQDTITASPEQIEAFTARYQNNFRPVQPLGEREVNVGDVETAAD